MIFLIFFVLIICQTGQIFSFLRKNNTKNTEFALMSKKSFFESIFFIIHIKLNKLSFFKQNTVNPRIKIHGKTKMSIHF